MKEKREDIDRAVLQVYIFGKENKGYLMVGGEHVKNSISVTAFSKGSI